MQKMFYCTMKPEKDMEPRFFRHFKGNYYRMLCIACDSESLERQVVYQALYGEQIVWVRPEQMFFEEIERDGRRIKRFEEISERDLPEDIYKTFVSCH